jgi:hypothetical protein
MANKLILLVLLAASLAACNMKAYTREEAPILFDALDTKPNGYKGSIGTDAIFEITETKASQMLLCRSVKIASHEGKSSRQYCKIKGGEWR